MTFFVHFQYERHQPVILSVLPNFHLWLITLCIPVCLSVCLVLFPSFHLFFSSSLPPPLIFGLCACGHQGNSSNLPTHVPVGQGAIRGQSTSLSSCHKWCWQDGEGPRLCFEGQRGRSPALCQWLLGPPDQQNTALKRRSNSTTCRYNHCYKFRVWVHILDVTVNYRFTFTPSSDGIS